MLFTGPFWYQSVPGAAETGPFNPHFVQDIGAAFLVAGLALAARRVAARVLARCGGRRRFHGRSRLIHLAAIVAGHDHHVGFDLVAVVLPSALALYSAFPNQGERHA